MPLLIKETFSIALNWFQAHGKNYIPSKIQIFSSIIKTTIIYLLFAHEKISLDIALIMFFAEYCFTTILIFIIFKKESGFKIQKTSVNNILSLLKESWSFGIGIFFMMILQRIDKFYLKSRISEYEFGLYSAASQITENILVFFSVFITTISPLLIYNKDNYYQVKNSLLILIITTLFISLTIITLINTFSSEIFSLVFGEIYKASSSIFLKLSPLIIIYTLDLSISSYFNKFNMGKTIMKKWIISFSTSFFLLGINNDANIDYSIISITLGYLLGFLYSLFSFKMKDNKLK